VPVREPNEPPPLLQPSPTGLISITLPSISDQLNLNQLDEVSNLPFAQSPPARPPPRFSAIPGHGSPSRSPNNAFRRELPSPEARPVFEFSHIRRPAPYDPDSGTETPSTGQVTPTTTIEGMTIDGITNPQIGGFHCTYPGCNAQPFQTQYVLNAHANAHSSNRPHYCRVKGCPRSEGGKGFKRKNEMIRHGLVHDSPGYVCPFCPDREHKYPRPDNLQRLVIYILSTTDIALLALQDLNRPKALNDLNWREHSSKSQTL
jgi:hypothetical protein